MICFFLSVSERISRTLASPFATRPWSASFILMNVPAGAATLAMPAPMKPAPRMPSLRTGMTAGTGSLTPGSFLSAVVAKNRKMSCCETSVAAISPNRRASSRNPFSMPPA